MTLAKKRHQKQLKRNQKNKMIRIAKMNALQRKNLLLKSQPMTAGTLLEKMLAETTVDNYEEWVDKLDLQPDLRSQLDAIVSEERERTELDTEKENANG